MISSVKLGLIYVIALAVALGFGGYQYQRAERYQEKVKPLEESLRASTSALRGCVAEGVRLRREGQDALAAAIAARESASKANEDFQRRLDGGDLPEDCDAILKVKVCPRLMDY